MWLIFETGFFFFRVQVLLLFICVCVCVCVGCPILSREPTSRNCVFHETHTQCLYWPLGIDRSRISFAWERIITMWEEVFHGIVSLGPHLAVVVARILPVESAKGITLFTSSDDTGTRPSTYHLVKLVALLLPTGADITGACNYWRRPEMCTKFQNV